MMWKYLKYKIPQNKILKPDKHDTNTSDAYELSK